MTLAELATRLGCQLEGDGALDVTRVAGLEDAGPGDVTFLANAKYANKVKATRASAIIASEAVRDAPCAVLRTSEPYLAFAEAVAALMMPAPPAAVMSPLAAIDPTADIGAGVSIGPFAAIGPGARVGARTRLASHVVIGAGAQVGADCLVHAHVSIRERVTIGDRVVIQDAAVIGSDGFGFARRPDGSHQKIPQIGTVVVEDDVEIGAHTTIDRPALGETRVGAGTKLDNLVHIAHGVRVGRRVLMAAQSGVAGSSVLEDDVVIAGQAGVTFHVRVGRGAVVGAKSVVTKNIEAGQHVTGVPAGPHEEWLEFTVLARRLPEWRAALAELQSRLAALETRLK
jgi:UDP-3-O-[3-hydroxymyristoyl] glucosamine N-acyltransferase